MNGFVAVLLLTLAGCYSFRPLTGPTPEVGSRVAFDITDAGRVALGGTMGPEIAQVEGDLLDRAGDDYVLAVRAVRLLRGGEQVWAGEPVRLSRQHVGTGYERRFSAGRSAVLGVAAVGGAAAFFLTRDLLGGGTTDTKDPMDSVVTRLIRP